MFASVGHHHQACRIKQLLLLFTTIAFNFPFCNREAVGLAGCTAAAALLCVLDVRSLAAGGISSSKSSGSAIAVPAALFACALGTQDAGLLHLMHPHPSAG